jgi:uncharacterized protein (TIGR00369 family)
VQYAASNRDIVGGSAMSDSVAPDKSVLSHAATQSRPPVSELIGFELSEWGEGRTVVVLQADTKHFNPMGTVHGGILCDIADAAMGIAFASTLAPGESFTTVELKINFLRPVRKAQLRAEGRVIQRGRTVGYVECEITDESGRLIAKSNSTCLVLRGEQAAGR